MPYEHHVTPSNTRRVAVCIDLHQEAEYAGAMEMRLKGERRKLLKMVKMSQHHLTSNE